MGVSVNCEWCGGMGAQKVSVHPTVVVRCNEQSPFDPRVRCRKAKGHLSECKGDAPEQPTFLCSRCFGTFRETGERPPAFRLASPQAGRISGKPFLLRAPR